MLSEADRDYLERRRKYLRYLGIAAITLCVLWLGILIFVLSAYPMFFSPWDVAERLTDGTLTWTTMRALAMMAPMLFLTVLLVISLSLYMWIRAGFRERRLLELVDRAERGSVSPP